MLVVKEDIEVNLFRMMKYIQKRFRFYKHRNKYKNITNIEHCRTDNSRNFWSLLRNLSVRSDTIPIRAKSKHYLMFSVT